MIIGIDEVGRGCWAGPLVAAAVLLQKPIAGLNDSKLLTIKQRERMAEAIKATTQHGIGWVWPEEIDDIGLTAATNKAMQQALDQITENYDQIIIDGNFNFLNGINPVSKDGSWKRVNYDVTCIPKADQTVPAVSAASILAKVARDQYMAEQAARFPNYGFDKHVGYGTKLHLEMLKLHGICELHRLSYKPIQALLL